MKAALIRGRPGVYGRPPACALNTLNAINTVVGGPARRRSIRHV
jgi:hypothetical protein